MTWRAFLRKLHLQDGPAFTSGGGGVSVGQPLLRAVGATEKPRWRSVPAQLLGGVPNSQFLVLLQLQLDNIFCP